MRARACRILVATLLAALTPALPAGADSLDDLLREVGATRLGAAPAAGFSLKTVDGGQLSLADLRGRAVMLYFWATW